MQKPRAHHRHEADHLGGELKLRNGPVGLRVRHCVPLNGHGACAQSVHLL